MNSKFVKDNINKAEYKADLSSSRIVSFITLKAFKRAESLCQMLYITGLM